MGGSVEVVELLLQLFGSNMDLKEKYLSGFIRACDKGHLELVKLFVLKYNVDIDSIYGHVSPFHLACKHGHTKIIQFFIEHQEMISMKHNEKKGF